MPLRYKIFAIHCVLLDIRSYGLLGIFVSRAFNQSIDRPLEKNKNKTKHCAFDERTIQYMDMLRWNLFQIENFTCNHITTQQTHTQLCMQKKNHWPQSIIYLGQVIAVSISRELNLSERKS